VFGKASGRAGPSVASAPATQAIQGNNNVQISGGNNTVNQAPAPRPCRDRSHGVERYQRTFDSTRTSHWMSGGFNQDRWCDQVIADLQRADPDGAFLP